MWADSEPTRAPRIGEPEPTEGYAATTPELAHRIISGKILVSPSSLLIMLPVILLIVVAWLGIQDNAAGKLQNREGFEWLGIKAAVVAAATLVVALILVLVEWLRRD
jgi:hypothetical protein